MSEDRKLRELLLKATENAEFRKNFLSAPEKVAKENGVVLEPKYVKKIKNAAAFIDSLIDIKVPPGPIYYPIDGTLYAWEIAAIQDTIAATVWSRYLKGGALLQLMASGRIIIIPPGYPAPDILGRLERGSISTR